MKKLKVMTILGTRPEIIRLSRVIAQLDEFCDHCMVHTGQNYDFELNEVFFNQLQVRRPDHFLNAARQTAAATIGQVIIAIDPILEQEAPNAILILGDTNSALAAIAAKRRKIPIFHMEAGNRSFDQRVPEEINRKIVDHISDINLTYSDIAREYLLREGVPPDRVIKTGSPLGEVLHHYRQQIVSSQMLQELELEPRNYYLVSTHREENVDNPRQLASLASVLNELAQRRCVIVSTHPRTRKRIDELGLEFHPRVRLLKPLGFLDYVWLQINATAVLSDSGTITEEASLLNLPALNLREAHERPEGMEEASVMMVGLDRERVLQGLSILERQPVGEQRLLHLVADYAADNVSAKVLRILHSYVDYVNRTVWRKE
ncbi:UDP-N-acetylglucosamine 2-epimerase (non-hydrolyzing) [Pseudomonas sp. GD04087]|uniref:non-hydrolyzing UDP-N-acetylglucosamine 2-epimerase n=1 Tax=unclassified Pseudomonas TaxID=196821 RepID=UPI00244BFA1B|nr:MULTISPECIES: UDP-N-acetylglucosamine 2-epimerase (non-hydrolyzing) [unclassified Pseudomonas]MDH0288655.1 UDP-N-acetylglucosamine 2-epimerase (non-hydrolyzing) [Pseudomonas sp. GD04087]MDH1049868.1 UDP-N-acetylglucosamine 2-epimerase (non-hydrolyzing) [Pseudomonas sp. GD03903]MDH1998135.1 UDP-N-acetylglucosamine 2-epimerase (non-hydrolyzing) [Pseudomonas sp. GD03691]